MRALTIAYGTTDGNGVVGGCDGRRRILLELDRRVICQASHRQQEPKRKHPEPPKKEEKYKRLSVGESGLSRILLSARLMATSGYSGEGEHRFRKEAERHSGAKVNSSRSEATLTW